MTVLSICRVLGVLFAIDGLSLLLRGVVGGVFLSHESAGTAFWAMFLVHTVVAGSAYVGFGIALVQARDWVFRFPGFLVATSALIWILPALGFDTVTFFLGAATLICLLIRKLPGFRGRPGGRVVNEK